MTSSSRLDTALVARGLAPSRTQAQTLLRDRRVLVDGALVSKASVQVDETQRLSVVPAAPGSESAWISRGWVGRGALKLQHALETWEPRGLVVAGRRCLDVGASTGGFTQVLLEHGAGHVVALDVGHGQLDPRLQADPRVTDLPRTNIRDVDTGTLGGPVGVVVSDVSFISLLHVLPVLAQVTEADAEIVLLVKPQFEVGRRALTDHGVVHDAGQRERALGAVISGAQEHGFQVGGLERSPVPGGSGNVEYLLWLRVGRTGMIGWGLAPKELAARCHELSQEEDR